MKKLPKKYLVTILTILIVTLIFLFELALGQYLQSHTFKKEYQENKTFCLKKSDCVKQKERSSCSYFVNKFNLKEVERDIYGIALSTPNCPKIDPICVENTCQNIYRLDESFYEERLKLFFSSKFINNVLNAFSQK